MDTYLKIDVKEVNEMIYKVEKEIKAIMNQQKEDQKEFLNAMTESLNVLSKAISAHEGLIKQVIQELGKVEVIKMQLTTEGLTRQIEAVREVNAETKELVKDMQSAQKSLPILAKELRNVETLMKSKAITLLTKELK